MSFTPGPAIEHSGSGLSVYISQAIVYNLTLNISILRPGFNAVGGITRESVNKGWSQESLYFNYQ